MPAPSDVSTDRREWTCLAGSGKLNGDLLVMAILLVVVNAEERIGPSKGVNYTCQGHRIVDS
jgi:hypothetical protein